MGFLIWGFGVFALRIVGGFGRVMWIWGLERNRVFDEMGWLERGGGWIKVRAFVLCSSDRKILREATILVCGFWIDGFAFGDR